MAERSDEAEQAERKRQTSYLREIASFNRRHELREALDDAEQRTAYELSDGSRSAQEVVDQGELSKSSRTIQRWWKEWVEAGLATRDESGSARARYDTWVIDSGADDG